MTAPELSTSRFIVLTDFGALGIGGADPTPDFDEAVDALAEHRGAGRPCRVFRAHFEAGVLQEVTQLAVSHLVHRLSAGRREFPGWLVDELEAA